MGIFSSAIRLKHMLNPGTPPTGESLLYPKTDGNWYSKNSDGIEAPAIGRAEDTGWIPLPLINGWANWGGGWAAGRYRRVNGIVYIEGFLNAAGKTANLIATLPEGFRPKEHISVAVPGINQTNGYTAISVTSAGSVEIQGGYSSSASSWVSLGVISYAVEQPTSFVVGDDTGWITPTLASPWANYGSGFTSAGYRRVNGIVYLRGLVQGGSLTSTIFTLPEGFLPEGGTKIFTTHAAEATARIDVSTGGVVSLNGTAPNTTYVSLEGVSFPAANPPVAFVSAGDVTLRSETLGGVNIARNVVAGKTLANGPRYIRINTTMRVDSGIMPRFHIVGKTNAYEGAFDGHLTIYLYNLSGGTLYSPHWKSFGLSPACFVAKDASNQLVILLDATTWHYAEVLVNEVGNTYGTMTKPQTEGWTVTNVADTTGLSDIVQAT